jgi:hypothetical protein
MIAVLALMKSLSRGEGGDVVVVVRLSKSQIKCEIKLSRGEGTEVTNQAFPLRRHSCPYSTV